MAVSFLFYFYLPSPTGSVISTPNSNSSLTIASFNIQTLGKTKIADPFFKEYLMKIIPQYDIIAIQELKDSSGEVTLILQQWFPNYHFVLSEELGRTSNTERYLVMYRKGKVLSYSVWLDAKDVFEREPLIVYFQVDNQNFSLINVHIKPTDAEKEISVLPEIINNLADSDFILLGDLNADCDYYDETQGYLKQYSWVIDNSQDTTVSSNNCTYDRIITNLNYSDFGVFNFPQKFGLNYSEAKSISDHLPVWVQIS